ncbi:hypothetical protein ACSBR1_012329 [Camellia fascicularis]
MDFMKVIDQTVCKIKSEVNLKVLKVPKIEQKDNQVSSGWQTITSGRQALCRPPVQNQAVSF